MKVTKETSGRFITAIYVCVMLIGFLLFFRLSYTNITSSKYYFFLVSAVVYLVLLAVAVVCGAKCKLGKLSITDIGMLLFGVAHLLAWCLTDDKYNAFFGEDSRHMGLLVYLLYIAIYFCVTRFLVYRQNYTYVFAFGCCLYYIMSVMQYFKVDFFGTYSEISEQSSHYFMATIGNVNFCAAFAASSIGFFSLLYATAKDKIQQVFSAVCCALGIMSLYVFNSDGGYLGLIAVAVLLILLFLTHQTTVERILELGLLYTGGIIFLFILKDIIGMDVWEEGISSILNRPTWFAIAFVVILLLRMVSVLFHIFFKEYRKEIVIIGTVVVALIGVTGIGVIIFFCRDWFLSHTNNDLGLTSGRTYIWDYVMDGYKEFPILNKIFGLGQETMREYCLTHNVQEYYAKFKSILDAAHCEYLHYLFTLGIFGAVSYFIMLISFLVSAFKWAKKNPMLYGMLGFVAVYATQAIVSIAEPAVTPFLFLMISIGCSMIYRGKQSNYSEQDCAELHSPYENVVAAGQNPSP